MAIVSVGMLRGDKDYICYEWDDGNIFIGAVLSGKWPSMASRLDFATLKHFYRKQDSGSIIELMDKSPNLYIVLSSLRDWYEKFSRKDPAYPQQKISVSQALKNMKGYTIEFNHDACGNTWNVPPKPLLWNEDISQYYKDEHENAMLNALEKCGVIDYKLTNKENRMLWKNKSDYAKENIQLRKELDMNEGELKLAIRNAENAKNYHNKAVNELEIAKSQYEHQIRKLKLELENVSDGTELKKVRDKGAQDAHELSELKKYVKSLEEKAMFHDIDVASYERHTKLLQEEIAALKEHNELIRGELSSVDGLTRTKQLVEVIKSLKEDESGMFDKLLKTIVETSKAK